MARPYRIISDQTWDAAKADYLAGLSGEAVSERHGVSLSALRTRARRQHWRQCDQPAPPPPPPVPPDDPDAPPMTPAEARDRAWRRLSQALDAADAPRTLRWLRIVRGLDALIGPAGPATHDPAPAPRPHLRATPVPIPPAVPPSLSADVDPAALGPLTTAALHRMHRVHHEFTQALAEQPRNRAARRRLKSRARKDPEVEAMLGLSGAFDPVLTPRPP